MAASASAAPYLMVEAALADGKSQAEIDAFLAVSPAQQENIVYAHAAVVATAAEQINRNCRSVKFSGRGAPSARYIRS